MLHAISQTLASAALLSILLGLPALYFLFSERFQRLPTARELSTLFIILARAGAGDPFGIFPRQALVGETHEIVVYPTLYRPEVLGLPFHEMIGEIIPKEAPVEDPLFLAGGREYRPGDPLHRMNWKATARS